VTTEILAAYADRISLKNIDIVTKLDKYIMLKIHPALADMMISNLLSNAIRHNVYKGSITIDLGREEFCISNTGYPPEIPTEELFQRFKKGNQSNDSIGLGLALVKQICEVSNFSVTYQYSVGWHTVRVRFNNADTLATPNLNEQVADKKAHPIHD
jgi:signal transduction histidine kinase